MTFSQKRHLHRQFRAEMDIATVYDALADGELNPQLKREYWAKAQYERERAAGIWIRLWTSGARIPSRKPPLRGRCFAALARRFSRFEYDIAAHSEALGA
jgi:hypothetical protein